ncbi:MAG: DUF3326 domain-containing protein [Candidatus Omnitrophica bacterium]|nr:DUF3326 domain-containing protein [Candidatus Omnitrophota bacterium]
MLITRRELEIPVVKANISLLKYFRTEIEKNIGADEIPVRFVVTRNDSNVYKCELGILRGTVGLKSQRPASIFDFVPRGIENTNSFNAVMIVPTGIGAEIGGHAGDATPAARLLACICDTLITHPNVVNASDINELPANGLYVEGSALAQLLMGTIGLQKVRANRLLLVIDKHPDSRISDLSKNAASAARSILGIDCPQIIQMDPSVLMSVENSSSGSAVGKVEEFERLCKVLQDHRPEYDAIALTSIIDVSKELIMDYFQSSGEMVNPWGGVEAMLTHAITMLFGVPAAHSPMLESTEMLELFLGPVDPRMAAEAISSSFLYCILKGLHQSPRIITDRTQFTQPGLITASDISCIVIPDRCVGLPTLAALEQGIPIIAVKENKNRMQNKLEELPFAPGKFFIADNYLEAAGVVAALKAGIAVESVKRPLKHTKIVEAEIKKMIAQR